VMNIQMGYGFRPDFSTPFWGYYYDVQTGGPLSAVEHYSYFDGGVGPASAPGWGSQSQTVSLSFNNTFEGKVLDKSDTTGTKTKKIKLLDGLTFGASYNLAASRFKLSLNDITARTNFFNNKLSVQFGMTLNPYKVDENYNLIDEYCFPRLTAARVTSSFSIANSDFNRRKEEEEKIKKKNKEMGNEDRGGLELEKKNKNQDSEGEYDANGYMVYSPTWNVSVTQTFYYTKTTATPNITNAVGLNASFGFTKKWSMTASTGYDFQRSEWAEVRFSFSRDLNTWNINFSWAPVSYYSNYSFFIGIKANMLKDLKYEQRKTYRKSLM
ncbi:MAG: putative LPS assembly protein LptD, partial [Flavobacteriales bacterium]|nr:putative LPS assembly protein LptD [Flavobacteriales bacterium]